MEVWIKRIFRSICFYTLKFANQKKKEITTLSHINMDVFLFSNMQILEIYINLNILFMIKIMN